MSAQARQSRTGTAGGAGGPSHLPPDHRKGKQPILLYVIGVVVVLAIGTAVLWATGALRTILAPTRPSSGPVSTRPSTVATSTTKPPAAKVPSTAPLPAGALAESASAVKAAALPFPNTPAVTPETISRTSPSRRLVAITLDDGVPFDTRILGLLEAKNVRLTTFLTGLAVKAHPDLVRRLNKDGFEIANHTYDNKKLTDLTDAEIRDELKRTQDAISAITGNQAPYMRPPGGATNAHIQGIAASMGYRVVLWDKTFGDDTAATPDTIFHNVMDGLKPGDIVVGHWGGKNTYAALQLILPEMRKRGLTPVTVSELLKYSSTANTTTSLQGRGGAGTPVPSAEASAATSTAGRAAAGARRGTTATSAARAAAVFEK
jgi:peptidoglycan-N-acetylglucosamine deacetylase